MRPGDSSVTCAHDSMTASSTSRSTRTRVNVGHERALARIAPPNRSGPKQEGTLATRTKQDAAGRHQRLGLSDRDLLDMYRTMLTARLCDEAQFRLNRQGKAPFVVPVSGHEGCQSGSAWPHRKGRGIFRPHYRAMGGCPVAG